MSPADLAKRYMECFFGHAPLADMKAVLADNMIFQGPFYTFSNANDYIDALQSDPPKETGYEILQVFENDNSACIIYRFMKPGIDTLMAQTFAVTDGKIDRITLIFDSGDFK